MDNQTKDVNVAQDTVSQTVKHRLPDLSKLQMFMMTFGYFGTQIAFSMQTGSMGRIFQTIGADPNNLGFFFILPPLAGMIMQPLVGYFSDKTWLPKFGRRMPYLIGGTLVSFIVMLLLPNAGSFGFGFGSAAALWFGAVTVLFMDLASNVSQQPFKMIIPDMANEKQSNSLWSMQNVWGSLGSLVAFVFPFILTVSGIANTAPRGEVPMSVKISFYASAIILALSAIFTIKNVKEYTPEEMAKYHNISEEEQNEKASIMNVLRSAPKVFWLLGIVEFFVWFAIPYMWTYSTGALAENIWHVTDPASAGYQEAGNWFGIVQAVYSVVAIIVGLFFARLTKKTRRPAYTVSLILGGIGFLMIAFGTTKLSSIIAFALFGIAWIALITIPFTILTNALDGKHDGIVLGLFNCFICIPQIVASSVSFLILPALGGSMAKMFIIAAIAFFIGGLAIWLVRDDV
ncbi:SLC45 family MFS transporter [Weissella sagaensis]|jgi:maltose/moltooligosaccharide transporter|uniref:SLC45 family MFS transporter n=1 Tax=Weissella sagaensis TaxID=2559928 RepID=A0ABW1RTL4_9LACO|nr:SLC45 family MFS transporter [Weissella sagaensis]KAA8433678.1 SLC45 family MFS transporter [Weissella paramesenteroides]MBU7567920.1 SLC45 family MFS transporter [Weissella hellenica]KAA8438503.1 SLC45 family MFS transporter [Weissella paramesenteroides]QDJ58813.1 MFS transporter [Weissella hellenica]QEA57772.1 SLC45 family MFS transporter [Weissella hellenica]